MSETVKKKLVLDLIEKHDITAYEIGKNTKISALAAQNIINGTTKNPRNKTLDPILRYIESRIIGSGIPGHKNYDPEKDAAFKAKEAQEEYTIVSNSDLQDSIKSLEKTLTQKLELLASAAEVTLLNTDELLDITKNTQDSFKNLAIILAKKGVKIS